jgi:hypothetical protein
MRRHSVRVMAHAALDPPWLRVSRPLTGLLTGALLAAGLVAGNTQLAVAGWEPLIAETFTGTTTASTLWSLPGTPDDSANPSNAVCLTGGGNTAQAPIPGCGSAVSPGALELTAAGNDQEGGVAYSLSVPTIDGVDAAFDTYQFGGDGADGISFFLAAANPADPTPPSAIGAPGGALGYSATKAGSYESGALNGMTDAYLAVGLDSWGNFPNTDYEGSGCTDKSWQKAATEVSNVTVRGPGSGTTGYCAIVSTLTSTAGPRVSLRSNTGSNGSLPSPIPVEIVINTTGSAVTPQGDSSASVPAGDFAVIFTPYGGSQTVLEASLPNAASYLPAGWTNGNGIPYQLTFGWVASTGADNDYHEVTNLTADTISGLPPKLGAAVSDNASGAPPHDSAMDYDITVSNASGVGDENATITATDTLPAGETVVSSGVGGTGWSCSTSGRTVTCTDPGPLDSGSSLPEITIPVEVTAAGGSELTNSVTVSSEDGDPGSASDTVTVAQVATSITASANPTSTTHGNTVQLSASGLPSDATGSVKFTSGGATLCTGTVGSGGASCSTAVLAAGTYPVTATYSGDASYVGSTASTSFSIAQAETSFTASANPSSTTYGNTVQLEASGLPSDATGTITFTAGGSTLCTTGVLSSGSASCTTGVLQADTYGVTGSYGGDINYLASTATTSFTVTRAATSLTASATPTGASAGNSILLAASGLPSGATGDVTFTAGGSTLCTTGALSSGSASCTADDPAPGSYAVTATYSGDTDHQGSTASTSFVITPDPVLDLSTSGTPAGAAAGTSYSLTLSPSLGASPASPAYHNPVLTVTLPPGETFAAAPSPSGWSCGLSGGDTVLTCTSSLAPITAGTSLTAVTATVDIASSARGALVTGVSLADSADGATPAGLAASVNATAPPVLGLVAVSPTGVSAGSSYALTLAPSLGASGGPAYNDPTLTATLPSDETFATAPVVTGWSCSVSSGGTVLTCTSSAAPIAAGTSLASVTAIVDVSASATGTSTVTASLTDATDLAAAADASASVGVTAPPALGVATWGTPAGAAAGTSYSLTLGPSLGGSPAGPAYHNPILFAILPPGETFGAAPSATGWSCALSVSDSVLTCTSTLAPIAAGTTLPGVTTTVDISSTALGTLQTTAALADGADAATTASAIASVDVTAIPVLDLSTSGTPPITSAGSTYTLSVSVALSPSGGPAYNEPTLTLVLPAGETFAAPTGVAGWSCSLSDGDTTLRCVRTAATPLAPGASLISLSVQVEVSSTASGELTSTVSAGDSLDRAPLAVADATTTVPVETPATGAPPGTPFPWALGALLTLAGLLLVAFEVRRRPARLRADRVQSDRSATGTPARTPHPWGLGALLVAAGLLLVACEARRRLAPSRADRA